MDRRTFLCIVTATLALNVIGTAGLLCPSDSNCICGGSLALDLNCDIDGNSIKISYLPNTYLSLYCGNVENVNYDKLPNINPSQNMSTFKSVIFKECPLPMSSFKEVLTKIGVSKTMALIFQNSKNVSSNLEKKQFTGLQDLSKLLLSINGITYLPDDLFEDMSNLTWLNIRSNGISLSENLFRPLERLETLEISHNHMTNISGNLFSHLAFLRKLSLWQSNVTRFSKDLFTGVNVLEELDLSSNGLNELPSSIFYPLKKLKKLTLFANKFSSLPSNLFKNNDGLDTIVIFNNDVKLKYLPKAFFSGLYQLKEVYIQRCNLEIVPSDLFINSPLITNISLAHNEIENLPESVFNDQINLLDLDLSNNRIKFLEPKLFSSLVKLERLILGHNLLKYISSFSSLLSLVHLEIDHNKLETLPSGLLHNNRQRIWINMAYNRMNFKSKPHDENGSVLYTNSPFYHLRHLKMLNLSHNNLQQTFEDWWDNAHENVDLSFNNIQVLRDEDDTLQMFNVYTEKNISHRRSTKVIWISQNPLLCNCSNYLFFYYLQKQHTKVGDIDSFKCPIELEISCDYSKTYMPTSTIIIIVTILISFCILFGLITAAVYYCTKYNVMYNLIKKWCHKYMHDDADDDKPKNDVVIVCAEKDENFVITEILPSLKCRKTLIVHTQLVNKLTNKDNIVANLIDSNDSSSVFVIILTSNYVASVHNDNELKKLYGNVINERNIIFVIVSDFGSDVSLNPFLKEHVINMGQCVTWREPEFWGKFLSLLKHQTSNNFAANAAIDVANNINNHNIYDIYSTT